MIAAPTAVHLTATGVTRNKVFSDSKGSESKSLLSNFVTFCSVYKKLHRHANRTARCSFVAESDGDSAEWPMEQDETIDSLLCETPSLLPTLSLSLASGPQAPEGPSVAPAAAKAPPAQTTVNSHNQDKGIKVRAWGLWIENYIFGDFSLLFKSFFHLFSSPCLCLQIKEENIIPQIKLEPHEVDQFLNLSPKGLKKLFKVLLLLVACQ